MRLSGGLENIKAWRLIITSNRGPVEYHMDQDKKLKKCYGAGSLITALKNVHERISKNTTWIALAMTGGDRIIEKQGELLQISYVRRLLNVNVNKGVRMIFLVFYAFPIGILHNPGR